MKQRKLKTKKKNGRYRSNRNAMLTMYAIWNMNYFEKLARNKTFPAWARKLTAVGLILKSNICSKKGHDWTDTSYGGPESGNMSVECDRCGQSHYTQLY